MTAKFDRPTNAAEWVLRLQSSDLAEDEVAAWVAWCEADPRNRKEFDAMESVWDLAGKVSPAHIHVSYPLDLSSEHLPVSRVRAASPVRQIMTGAVAASLVFAVGLLALWQAMPRTMSPSNSQVRIVQAGTDMRLETERGHMTSARLEDGSQVDLGGRSALTVHFTPQKRTIIADEGEAFYQVAKNRERPFVVQAGAITVTAVGTAFSVARDDNSVTVIVTEGLVEIKASPETGSGVGQPTVLSVAAGQRALFNQGKLAQSIDTVDSQTAISWRDGRLEFRDEPLRLAAARISRYADRDIVVSDPRIEDLRVTGTAYIDRVDAWLAGIETVLPVRAERLDAHHTLIRSAP